MKLVQVLNELRQDLANEVEIIYKDKDLIVMMPKSQMASKIFGKGTRWCQIGKPGFEMWSESGLLIRFLMRGGRKIRFTYFFKNMPMYGDLHPKGSYYWANETGYHVLNGTNDPFHPKPMDPTRPRDIELDIINQISKIPEVAREKVREFIEKYKDGYEYCYRKQEYNTKKEIEVDINLGILRRYKIDMLDEMYKDRLPNIAMVDYGYDYKKHQYLLNYYDRKGDTIRKYYKNFEDAKNEFLIFLQKMYKFCLENKDENYPTIY